MRKTTEPAAKNRCDKGDKGNAENVDGKTAEGCAQCDAELDGDDGGPGNGVGGLVANDEALRHVRGFPPLGLLRHFRPTVPPSTDNALARYLPSLDETTSPEPHGGSGECGLQRIERQCKRLGSRPDGRYDRHPWLSDVVITGMPRTPNSVEWIESLLESLADSPLTENGRLSAALMLQGTVRNYAAMMRSIPTAPKPTPPSSPCSRHVVQAPTPA
ncbi:hypothetical protein ACX80S_17455 [Arthrobacter sp. RHLT1-20]